MLQLASTQPLPATTAALLTHIPFIQQGRFWSQISLFTTGWKSMGPGMMMMMMLQWQLGTGQHVWEAWLWWDGWPSVTLHSQHCWTEFLTCERWALGCVSRPKVAAATESCFPECWQIIPLQIPAALWLPHNIISALARSSLPFRRKCVVDIIIIYCCSVLLLSINAVQKPGPSGWAWLGNIQY